MVAVFYSAEEFLKQVLHDAARTIILLYLCNFQSFLKTVTLSGATFICQLLICVLLSAGGQLSTVLAVSQLLGLLWCVVTFTVLYWKWLLKDNPKISFP